MFSKNLILNRADVLRENAEAVFAACDAAHGRWAKLLGVRAVLHPRLKLQEFLTIYNITHEFITATEKVHIFILICKLKITNYVVFDPRCISHVQINRLVEDWDTASVGHCSHRPKLLLIFSMNLGLVLILVLTGIYHKSLYIFHNSCFFAFRWQKLRQSLTRKRG